jgi:hypothetical protein
MNQDRKDFLSITKLVPARLDSQETAWFLGFATHDIPVLVRAGLLKPLGHPPPNGVKYFSSTILSKLRDDPQWLSRATDALTKCWKNKNALKLKRNNIPVLIPEPKDLITSASAQ